MTIAISLKVNDGLVLASDSAATLMIPDSSGTPSVLNVYNNANKIFNLRKGLPLGAITWGAGSIGSASISTLVKDLRCRFAGDDPKYTEWELDPQNYSVQEVAQRFKTFIFDELYASAFKDWPTKPDMGFVVAGHSSGSLMAEEYTIQAIQGSILGPDIIRPDNECGLSWNGQPEAVHRIVLGFGTQLPTVLKTKLGVPEEQIPMVLQELRNGLQAPLIMPAMPIQDAIELAEFLVDVSIKFFRFMPGAPTVGGPIEIAAITKHEGFKWIKRKHYYNDELNPG